jgi:hypothetical protein
VLLDRCHQARVVNALEPEWEARFRLSVRTRCVSASLLGRATLRRSPAMIGIASSRRSSTASSWPGPFCCLLQLDRGCGQPKPHTQPYERDRTPRGALATSLLLERS